MTRQIPAQGVNLFQSIYGLLREYEEKTGLKPLNLSLGNPDGVPPKALLRLQARCAGNADYDFHAYAEDKNLLGFAEALVELHAGVQAAEHPHLKAVPIAGIKTATALLPLACGLHEKAAGARRNFRVASNLPAYDVIGAWSQNYLGAKRLVWPLCSSDNMRPSLPRLKDALKKSGGARLNLIFVIRPGNPASVSASAQEWRALIRYCLKEKIRLVNDAAYCGLASKAHVPLAKIAKDFPALEWIEMYSVSKSFSDPGARLGAMIGSRDFIEDFLLIKGNADSGPVPSIMAAYGKFLSDRRTARRCLDELRALYRRRAGYVELKLKEAGLRPACRADSGFFTLWKTPGQVLGVNLAEDLRFKAMPLAEGFNRLVSAETGIAGVHFNADPESGVRESFIRYAVCSDVLSPSFQARFERQLARLEPVY